MYLGDIVRLNPEIFPEDKRKEDNFQAGSLWYPSFLLREDFKILEFINDKNMGKLVKVKVTTSNFKVFETDIYLMEKDILISKE